MAKRKTSQVYVGGFAYDVAYGGANLARLRLSCALPPGFEHPVDSAQEYSAFRVRVLRSKTTGRSITPAAPGHVQLRVP